MAQAKRGERSPLDGVRRRLRETRRAALSAHKARQWAVYERLTKLEVELAGRLVELEPPPPPDPELDPSYCEARRRLMARMRELSARAEEKLAAVLATCCAGCAEKVRAWHGGLAAPAEAA